MCLRKNRDDIFSADIKNKNTIKDQTNKAISIVDWISTRLIERPYGNTTSKLLKS